ncbi:MAG: hypothetical protein HXY41_12145 [Chloroflexi bacterium]|nr:hypothetical protein [Chloroflexota bacterium]
MKPCAQATGHRRDEATYRLFLQDRSIGLGFGDELGDLSKLESNPQAFRDQWLKKHPESSPKQANIFYAMFYSFIHRVKIGDFVVYAPTWRERKVYVGKVIGPYRYNRSLRPFYSHRRSVEWRKEFYRSSFSPEALRGIRVKLAIFHARNEAFLAELSEKLK